MALLRTIQKTHKINNNIKNNTLHQKYTKKKENLSMSGAISAPITRIKYNFNKKVK